MGSVGNQFTFPKATPEEFKIKMLSERPLWDKKQKNYSRPNNKPTNKVQESIDVLKTDQK